MRVVSSHLEEDERLLHLLTYELARQCRLSDNAVNIWRALPALVGSGIGPTEEANRQHLNESPLLYAHAFLTHAGNASKLLWPSPPYKRDHPYDHPARSRRASRMRQNLKVFDDSALKQRDLRNHFEHLDERLELWYQTPAGQRLDLVDLNRIPFGPSSPDAPLSPLRMFETGGKFRVMGDTYEFGPLHSEVIMIRESAEGWLVDHRHILDDRSKES